MPLARAEGNQLQYLRLSLFCGRAEVPQQTAKGKGLQGIYQSPVTESQSTGDGSQGSKGVFQQHRDHLWVSLHLSETEALCKSEKVKWKDLLPRETSCIL